MLRIRLDGSSVQRLLVLGPFLLALTLFLPATTLARDSVELDAAVALPQIRNIQTLLERAAVMEEAAGDAVVRLGSVTAPSPDFAPATWPEEGQHRGAETDWTPFAGAFGVAESGHLHRRAVIGPTWSEIESGASDGMNSSVAALLAAQVDPQPPGPWVFDPVPDVSEWTEQMIQELIDTYRQQNEMLRMWWTEVMIDQDTSVNESMVHFWHDHFATGSEKVLFPMSMYLQNDLFREHATGNFRELVRAVSYDPAMLLWLDNQVNYSGNINENFARELLELFTLGVDQYTQDDIIDVARSFTGWVTPDAVTTIFIPEYHDYGLKTVLGDTGYWHGDDVIDIIFEQDETARFICRKLYKWFVDEYPDEVLVEELAQIMRASDYELAPVLETIFKSEHFYDLEIRGSVVTDGVDHYAGLPRSLEMADQINLSNLDYNQSVFTYYCMYVYGHFLFDPPNVAGWPGYRTWVNSYTMPWRKTLDIGFVDGITLAYPINMQADILAVANQMQDPNDPYQLIEDFSTLLFGMQPTELVEQRMLDEILQGSEPWEWSINDPNAEGRLQDLVRLAMRLPDIQLK